MEARNEAQRRALQAQIEAESRARQELIAEVEALGVDIARTLTDSKIEDVGLKVHMVEMLIKELHSDIRMVRTKVDPNYVHPDEPLVEALMEKLDEKVEEDSRRAKRPGTPPD